MAEFRASAAVGVEGIKRQVELKHPPNMARDLGLACLAVYMHRDRSALIAQAEPDNIPAVHLGNMCQRLRIFVPCEGR